MKNLISSNGLMISKPLKGGAMGIQGFQLLMQE